jgi:thiol-disulfide isomerase/thioredoxin
MLLELPLRPVITCLLVALLAGGCDRQKADEPQGGGNSSASAVVRAGIDRSHRGEATPDVQFQDPDGEPATLADFRGKPLLLNLWATWCAPCVAEMPTLDALASREGERLQVLALSQDLEGRAKVDQFFTARGLRQLDPFLDSEMAMMTALRATALPVTILYDAQGREVWRMNGPFEWDGEEARRLTGEGTR